LPSLSRDPDYVAYALWMERHGLFRFVGRLPLLRALRYRPPAGDGASGGDRAG
jgi:hypothetical protein